MARPKTQNIGSCKVEGCTEKSKSMNMCNTHYMQHRRGARSAEGILLRALKGVAAGQTCKVEDCSREVLGRGFCSKHYQQWANQQRTEEGEAKASLHERSRGVRSGSCKICDQPMHHGGTGFCGKHYAQFKREQIDAAGNELRAPLRAASYAGKICKIQDCGVQPRAYGFCDRHRQQVLAGLIDIEGAPLRDLRHGGMERRKTIWKTTRGYLYEYAPGHPGANKDNMVLQHRLVMSRAMGRPLHPWEDVHHKNGKRSDNRLENLEVLDGRAGDHPDRPEGPGHPPSHEFDVNLAVQVLLQHPKCTEDLAAWLEWFRSEVTE